MNKDMYWNSKISSLKKRKLVDEDVPSEIDITALLGGLVNNGNKLGRNIFSGETNLYTIDNNIFFQDDITMDSISSLNRELRLMQAKMLEMGTNYNIDPPPIRLHLTTYGGSVFAALSAIDCIKELKVPVHSICDGYVASAGTLISVVAAKRFIKPNAHMLLHELRSEMWGKMSEMEDEMQNLKQLMDVIKKIYLNHTKLKKKDISDLLKHDINWNAQQCIEYGIVDAIL